MPDHRKPAIELGNRSGSRHDGAQMPEDSGDFRIDTTTFKSLRLLRVEVADQEVSDAAKQVNSQGSVDMPRSGPSGRVRHDERGVAVWDWAVSTGEFATLSTTGVLKKLEVDELKLEVSGRDKAGGFDPYNQRGYVLGQLTGKKK
jgi:hypothetical protein